MWHKLSTCYLELKASLIVISSDTTSWDPLIAINQILNYVYIDYFFSKRFSGLALNESVSERKNFCASLLQPLTTWSILSSAFLHSLHSVSFWLLSIFALAKFVLVLWFCAATIRLYVSLFKSPFWSQPQFCSLLTSLVCLKY